MKFCAIILNGSNIKNSFIFWVNLSIHKYNRAHTNPFIYENAFLFLKANLKDSYCLFEYNYRQKIGI